MVRSGWLSVSEALQKRRNSLKFSTLLSHGISGEDRSVDKDLCHILQMGCKWVSFLQKIGSVCKDHVYTYPAFHLSVASLAGTQTGGVHQETGSCSYQNRFVLTSVQYNVSKLEAN